MLVHLQRQVGARCEAPWRPSSTKCADWLKLSRVGLIFLREEGVVGFRIGRNSVKCVGYQGGEGAWGGGQPAAVRCEPTGPPRTAHRSGANIPLHTALPSIDDGQRAILSLLSFDNLNRLLLFSHRSLQVYSLIKICLKLQVFIRTA